MDVGLIWDGIQGLILKLLKAILTLLPTSPFIAIQDKIGEIPFLSFINWFIPFDMFVVIGEIWLVSVGLFYLYMIVLRWVKAIE